MFLIRAAFWIGLVVLLLPSDERQQARLYATAAAAIERATTFCDRNAQMCAASAELWAKFVRKAEFAARMAIDLATSSGSRSEEGQPAPIEPSSLQGRGAPASPPPARRGTLTPADLEPAWRGQPSRARI